MGRQHRQEEGDAFHSMSSPWFPLGKDHSEACRWPLTVFVATLGKPVALLASWLTDGMPIWLVPMAWKIPEPLLLTILLALCALIHPADDVNGTLICCLLYTSDAADD